MLPLLLCLLLQDAPSDLPPQVELPETVVRAPRSTATVTTTSAKVTVVTGEELLETGESTLPRALGEAAGVWVQETNLGGGAPVIRGLLGNQILIVVDGVRLNDSTTRIGPNQSLNTIDPRVVDRVEIVRGPSSVLYGSDAIGGAIIVWTKRRRPASQDAEEHRFPVGGGTEVVYDSSVDGGRASVDLSGAHEDHALLGIGTLYDFEDLEVGDGRTFPYTGYDGHALFGAYEYAVGERRTLRATARFNRDFNVPRTDKLVAGYGQDEPSNADYRYSLQDRRAYLLSYTDDKGSDWFDRMQVRGDLGTYLEQRDTRKTGATTRAFEEDEVTSFGLGVDWRKGLGDAHLLTWGIDLGFDDVDSSRRDYADAGGVTNKAGTFAPDSKYTRAGIFVQDELLSLSPWFATLGLRYSYYDFSFHEYGTGLKESGDFDALTASLEVGRDLGGGTMVTASVAQGYRAPNLDDLANDKDFAGGDEIHNPNLGAEESLSADLGLAVEKRLWSGSVGVFATRIDDYIGRSLTDAGDPLVDGDETYLRENTGTVDLWGAEAAARCRLFTVDSPFAVSANIAYARGEQKDPLEYSGATQPARRVPPLFGQVALHWDSSEPVLSIGHAKFFVQWADEQDRLHPQDASDPRIDPNGTPGWATYNLDLGGAVTDYVDWWVGLYNLTDKLYRVHSSGVDAPGARVVFGLRLEV